MLIITAVLGLTPFLVAATPASDFSFNEMLVQDDSALLDDEGCTDFNFYTDTKDPFNFMPVSNQGETSLCYAYTVAQLAEYNLRKTGQWSKLEYAADDHLDPIWVAVAHKISHLKGLRFYKNDLGNGYFKTAYQDFAARGICNPSTIKKSIEQFKKSSTLIDPDYFFLYEQLWSLQAKGKNDKKHIAKLLVDKDVLKIQERAFGNVFNGGDLLYKEIEIINEQIATVPERPLKNKKKMWYLRHHVFGACKGDQISHPELPEAHHMGLLWASNQKLKNEIDRNLDGPNPSPVAIGYCSKLYHEDDWGAEQASKRRLLMPRAFRAIIQNKCSTHYSLIVGRRKSPETGACQYLIRNTAGSDYWTKRYQCLCKTGDGTGVENCEPTTAEPRSTRVLGCWIDETPLLNSVYDLGSIKPYEN